MEAFYITITFQFYSLMFSRFKPCVYSSLNVLAIPLLQFIYFATLNYMLDFSIYLIIFSPPEWIIPVYLDLWGAIQNIYRVRSIIFTVFEVAVLII